MMKQFLPSVTQPWNRCINRRHEPKPGRYSDFRSCLRWEFGFSCAFCLLHETDLMLSGAEGWGLMQIEHSIPRSKDFSQRDTYTNLFFICARCNWSRGASPKQDAEGRLLLDPCAVAWADRFGQDDGEIFPRLGDDDALHTCEAYGLNDPQKKQIRIQRRDWIKDNAIAMLEILGLQPGILDRLVEDSENRTASDLLEQLAAVRGLRMAWTLLLKNLERYTPIPLYPDDTCRCGHTDHHTIPEVLSEQTVSLMDLLERAMASKAR